MEGGHQIPSEAFARLAEWRTQQRRSATERLRQSFNGNLSLPQVGQPPALATFDQPSAAPVVEHDDADLHYDGRFYRLVHRRRLRNASDEPVTRYLIRISVDRYPGNPERSNQHYRENPLTWQELDLHAECRGEPMHWSAQHDRDSFKEVWLLFENDHGRFPLYPGESTTIDYGFTCPDTKYGQWFQRAVRLPTERVSVQLFFPAELAAGGLGP